MTPLGPEWEHLIVIALVFCIPIMSAFFAAYLLIALLMLIRSEIFICGSAGMDLHWLVLLQLSPSWLSSNFRTVSGKQSSSERFDSAFRWKTQQSLSQVSGLVLIVWVYMRKWSTPGCCSQNKHWMEWAQWEKHLKQHRFTGFIFSLYQMIFLMMFCWGRRSINL